jgi:hypothetical protein
MPQNYSEYQLQRNRITGQVLERVATRAIMIGADILKFLFDFLRTLFSGLTGR